MMKISCKSYDIARNITKRCNSETISRCILDYLWLINPSLDVNGTGLSNRKSKQVPRGSQSRGRRPQDFFLHYSQGCEDATEHTVTEWLSCDTEASQLYTDEEIISLLQNKPQDDSDLEETDEPQNVLVSHSEAANALEIALRYIEKSENATSTDIIFMRRWHNIASTSRITSLRQTNLTNFFTSKIVNVNVYVMC
ncbi:hypothetical protein AVEN_164845-1 [Araneus ventricosus]|uniref:Jerky-like n=1 Tax=Araneus ventricosus TaxID=182803 RepID=A0A4Y2ISG0_ARAVE|nr:hypothetical protein AVEN_164845-1 [Araneus ventricosus]